MAQGYQTIYRKYYRKHPLTKVKNCKPEYFEFSSWPEGGNWLDTQPDIKESSDYAKKEVEKMYKDRYITTYQKDYCKWGVHRSGDSKNVQKAMEVNAAPRSENELLEYAKKLFGEPTDPVLPPLNSARSVLGYMNPKLFNSELSTYQNDYGRNAYKILSKGFDHLYDLDDDNNRGKGNNWGQITKNRPPIKYFCCACNCLHSLK